MTIPPRETRSSEENKAEENKAIILRDELKFRQTIEELTAEGDTVVARVSGHGEIGGKASRRTGINGIDAVTWNYVPGRLQSVELFGSLMPDNRHSEHYGLFYYLAHP